MPHNPPRHHRPTRWNTTVRPSPLHLLEKQASSRPDSSRLARPAIHHLQVHSKDPLREAVHIRNLRRATLATWPLQHPRICQTLRLSRQGLHRHRRYPHPQPLLVRIPFGSGLKRDVSHKLHLLKRSMTSHGPLVVLQDRPRTLCGHQAMLGVEARWQGVIARRGEMNCTLQSAV